MFSHWTLHFTSLVNLDRWKCGEKGEELQDQKCASWNAPWRFGRGKKGWIMVMTGERTYLWSAGRVLLASAEMIKTCSYAAKSTISKCNILLFNLGKLRFNKTRKTTIFPTTNPSDPPVVASSRPPPRRPCSVCRTPRCSSSKCRRGSAVPLGARKTPDRARDPCSQDLEGKIWNMMELREIWEILGRSFMCRFVSWHLTHRNPILLQKLGVCTKGEFRCNCKLISNISIVVYPVVQVLVKCQE